MVLILMYRRRSGIAASSVYPKKTNVAAPTTLVIVDTVFFKKPPLAISCTMTYGWMSFSYQEVAKKPLAMRPRMLSVISNSHLRFSPYSLLRKAKGKLQPHSDTETEPCWRWLPSSSTLRKKDPRYVSGQKYFSCRNDHCRECAGLRKQRPSRTTRPVVGISA